MESFRAGDLAIDTHDQPGKVVVVWTGKSIDRTPHRVLEPLLLPLLAKTAASGGSALEMHFERLVHFNSSTISFLIHFIGEARAKGVRLALVYDAKAPTQRLSFDALRVFAKDNPLLELRTIG